MEENGFFWVEACFEFSFYLLLPSAAEHCVNTAEAGVEGDPSSGLGM